MRIGFVINNNEGSNVNYRASGPALALERAGHQIEAEFPRKSDHGMDLRRLRTCDAVHVYRYTTKEIIAQVDDLRQHGVAITWDNDDDIRLVPAAARRYTRYTDLEAERDFRDQPKLFRRVDLVTTTTDALADRWRALGAPEVLTIPNYMQPEQYATPRRRKDRIVIGWVAGLEHEVDAEALSISEVLAPLMARHPNVHVVTVGVRLRLSSERYEHHRVIQLRDLPEITRTFDVGIAPICDVPMNHARSDVKLKEYAAAGVPWLASGRGPYAPLGAREGGTLVADDGWEEALETVVSSRLWRFRMSRRAAAWGKQQRVDRHVERWVEAFERAIGTALERRVARPTGVNQPAARRRI